MTTISATMICDSINEQGNRLSTLLCRYPRWIHAEGRTHRLLDIGEDFAIEPRTPSLMECDDLSRNAGSSRAIPVNKMIDDVMADPAVPIYWGANQRGMQASEELSGMALAVSKDLWMQALDSAVHFARELATQGAHKQIVNRLLEPFSHITVLVTATEWTNFFALRDHHEAEPHIHKLAVAMKTALQTSVPTPLLAGQWHLPFITETERMEFVDDATHQTPMQYDSYPALVQLSMARCASTSYKTVDGFDMTLEKAHEVFNKLIVSRPVHGSPAEHLAQADRWGNFGPYFKDGWGIDKIFGWEHEQEHANFVGFRQFRKQLPFESV